MCQCSRIPSLLFTSYFQRKYLNRFKNITKTPNGLEHRQKLLIHTSVQKCKGDCVPFKCCTFLLHLKCLRLIGFVPFFAESTNAVVPTNQLTVSTAEHNMHFFYFFLLFVFSVKHSFIGERAVFRAFFQQSNYFLSVAAVRCMA